MKPDPSTGVVIVDHGSRRAESNDMLLRVVANFVEQFPGYEIVEPAHMELAEPSIATAFDRCVARGVTSVVVLPYFLLPGKHWDQDIPKLTAEAAAKHPGVKFMVTAPIGLHPAMAGVIASRLEHCVSHAGGTAPQCEACVGKAGCSMRVSQGEPATTPTA